MSKRNKAPAPPQPALPAASARKAAVSLPVLAGVALLALLAFLAYFPSLGGRFLWDDDSMLTCNEFVQAPDGLHSLWLTTKPADYWPMTYTSLWLEWRLWGMNPTGYRVTNLLLHIAAALLIWRLLRQLSIPGAFLAALLFAVHPVNVESVAWIAQRKNTLALVFLLLSILCYLKADSPSPARPGRLFQPGTGRWYALSLLAFTLAMLSKASVATQPLMLLLLVWYRRKLAVSDLVRTAPFFAISSALVLVNLWFNQAHTAEVIRTAGGLERLLGAGGALWFYLCKAIWPVHLLFVYPQWHIVTAELRWWLPLLAAVGLTGVLWWYRKTWGRPALLAWGFFCLGLVPVLGLTDVYFMRYALVADHYQHIAIIGVIALAAALWSRWHRQAGPAANLAAVVVVGVLAWLTWQQSQMYSHTRKLFQATLERNPACWMAHNNLGMLFLESGEFELAKASFEQTIALNPDYPEAHNNLAVILAELGQVPQAIEQYQHAVRLKPDYTEAWMNLATDYAKTDRSTEALAAAQKALDLARSKGQTTMLRDIQNWIDSRQVNPSSPQ